MCRRSSLYGSCVFVRVLSRELFSLSIEHHRVGLMRIKDQKLSPGLILLTRGLHEVPFPCSFSLYCMSSGIFTFFKGPTQTSSRRLHPHCWRQMLVVKICVPVSCSQGKTTIFQGIGERVTLAPNCTIDLASSDGLAGMKVDNDRLGQLRVSAFQSILSLRARALVHRVHLSSFVV